MPQNLPFSIDFLFFFITGTKIKWWKMWDCLFEENWNISHWKTRGVIT